MSNINPLEPIMGANGRLMNPQTLAPAVTPPDQAFFKDLSQEVSDKGFWSPAPRISSIGPARALCGG
jgi:NADH-quinone oxidoreductase subunit B